MWSFINAPSYFRAANTVGDKTVLGIGYDNFTVTKPLHSFRIQTFYTWHFIISGSGKLEVENKKFKLKSGDMFFLPPNVKFRYYPDLSDPWEYVWFSLEGETAEYYRDLIGFSNDVFTLNNKHCRIINATLKSLFESMPEKPNRYFVILSVFYKIMDICVSHIPVSNIKYVKEIIDAGCMSQFFNIESLCRDVGISHAHLLRLFKKEYGLTLINYVIKKRVMYACELLETTDLPVTAVAFSCGFQDAVHFMKTFKKETGITAVQYRNGHK
ncbi:MAG TPA: hypothetical protein DCP17_07785 [Ruminococcaceae bacterium]|nr:hypothetical protein [Oscillospiraceae bacterium]